MASARRKIPALPRHLLLRPELESVLDDGASLTVVHGVQGYGKTTLLAAWASHREAAGEHVVWITGEEALNDAARLDATIGSPLADGTVVVVDDLHLIQDETALRRLLRTLDEAANVRLVVSTRSGHPIVPMAAGAIDMRIVHAHELTLSVQEIVELSRVMGRTIDADAAARLRASVGGWMAAARIILEAASGETPLPIAAAKEYLARKVLPSVENEAILDQLRWFSLVDRLDTRMVRDLAGHLDSDALMRGLEEPGLLERRYDDNGVELRFPSLIRDILRESLEHDHPEVFREAHRQFAIWYRGESDWAAPIAAFEHAVLARDGELMRQVWAAHAGRFAMSFPERYARALARVPEEVTAAEPGMLVDLTSIAVVADGLEGELDGSTAWFRSYADASVRALAADRELSFRDLLHFGAGQLIGLRISGRPDEATETAVALTAAASERMARGEYPGDRLPWFYLQTALCHGATGDEEAAVHFYTLAWEHGARLRLFPVEGMAAGSLALIHAFAGAARPARLWLDRHRAVDSSGWFEHLVVIAGDIAAALLCLDRLDTDGYDAESSGIADVNASLDAWQFLVWLRTQHGLHVGDPIAALSALDDDERVRRIRHGSDVDFPLLVRARVDLLIAAGRAEDAMAVIQAKPHGLLVAPTARLRLLSGDPEGAIAMADGALTQGPVGGRHRLELSIISAVAALRLGRHDAARAAANRAFELQRSTGILRAFSTISAADRAALLELSGGGLTEDEIRRLDARRTVYPDSLRPFTLSDVEYALLEALDRGYSRKRIAETFAVTATTVTALSRTLYEKLGVTSAEGAVRAARRAGLLSRPTE